MSTPPKCFDDLSKARAHRCRVGDVAAHRERRAADRLARFAARRGSSTSSSATSAPAAANALRGRGADRAGRAGDHRDLAGERLLWRRAELGLLERPVFHVEHVGFGDRREAADRLGVGDGLDRGFGEVGGDARVLLAAAEPEQAEAGHQDHARAAGSSIVLLPPTRALLRAK